MPIILRWLAPYFAKGLAIVGLLFAAWFYIGHVERSARADQKRQDEAAVKIATLKAEKAALDAARAKEAQSARNTSEANDKLLSDLSAHSGELDAYIMRLKANSRGTGGTCLPSTADAASIIDRADSAAVLESDLRACEVNTARLINAREWALKELTE